MPTNLHSNKTDRWLTPPELIKACGKFDTDPCCEVVMPWRTAQRMFSVQGLEKKWIGRVWLNPPYSNCRPWVEKLVDHGHGILLASAKSTDSRWGQLALSSCDEAWFFAGRLLFHFPDGTKSTGKWLSNVLLSYGENIPPAVKSQFPGVGFKRS